MKCIIEGNIERALNNSNILKNLLVKQLQTYFDATDVYHDETHYSVVNTNYNVSSQTECVLEELTIDNNCKYLTVQDDGSVISKKMHNNIMHCRLKFADSVYIIRCTKSLDEDAAEHEYDVVSVVPSPEQDEPDEEYEAGSVTIKDSDINEIIEAIKSLK